jgi:hypothetical protein
VIRFEHDGKPVMADAGEAQVTIAGKEAKSADLTAGLSCDISYLGNGDVARSVACQ